MRKLSLFVLMLLAALATAANAQPGEFPEHPPSFNVQYTCTYPQGPWGNERNPGWLIFTDPREVGQPNEDGYIIWGIELYQATIPQGHDNRRIALAKPVNGPPIGPQQNILRTTWELTRDNVQCKNTVVRNHGRNIFFGGCTNGKTRTCSY